MARKLLSYEQCTNGDSNVRKITDFDEDNIEDDQIVKAKITLEEANFLLQKVDYFITPLMLHFFKKFSISTRMSGMKIMIS